MDASVRKALAQARAQFDQAVPGLTDARNILVHFDEYAVGRGNQQCKLSEECAVDPVDAAREFWPFGYNPATSRIRVGPYEIDVEAANDQARQLQQAIYMAGRAVDAAALGRAVIANPSPAEGRFPNRLPDHSGRATQAGR